MKPSPDSKRAWRRRGRIASTTRPKLRWLVMGTLADSGVRTLCCDRVSRLGPDIPPRWGRMTAHQMVCHLNDSFQVGAGERIASSAPSLFPWAFVRWIALRTSVPWAHNMPTRPEIKQGAGGGGTPPKDWARDCGALCEWIHAFPSREQFAPHPMFG